MTGRQENEKRIENEIKSQLRNAPSILQVWDNLMAASGLSAATRRDRIQKVKFFLRCVPILDRDTIIEYFKELRKKNVTDTYRIATWYALKSYCEFLFNEGIAPMYYMAGITCGKNHDVPKPVTITAKNMATIRDNVSSDNSRYNYAGGITLKQRDSLIVAILIETGLRESALTSIDVSDIDVQDQSIRVIEKGNVPRTIYLSDNSITILSNWLVDREKLLVERQKNTDALFISRDGDRISHDVVRYVVKKYSGNKINPHKIRGGYCSILYEETHDIEFVRRAVGHAYATTTQRYIHTDDREGKKGMEIINKKIVDN